MTWRADPGFLRHALIVVAGHYYWLLPLAPLLWLIFHGIRIFVDPANAIAASSVQGQLIGVPLTALAVFLGIRIIAGEIEDRSLEIAYTVPGGCERLWFAKLTAAILLLLVSEALLALMVMFFFTPFPPGALYGAMQAACFYMILAMALGALFRGEASGAIATVVVVFPTPPFRLIVAITVAILPLLPLIHLLTWLRLNTGPDLSITKGGGKSSNLVRQLDTAADLTPAISAISEIPTKSSWVAKIVLL